jgi:glycosyltransferase involved in cell wall biosynthesis
VTVSEKGRPFDLDAAPLHAAHVIAGLDAAHGGPSYSVPRLCEALGAAGAEATLLSVSSAGAGQFSTSNKGYADRRFRGDHAQAPILHALRSSAGLVKALHETAAAADVIHNHGLWLMPNVHAGRAAARAVKPLVVSPRGMLAPAALAFSRWKKRGFWRLLQGPALRRVACIHATAEQEYQEVRAFGLTAPVAIIANGIDLPGPGADRSDRREADRVVLSLSRIHPIKGLDRLLRAWAKVEARHPDWRLRIMGPSESGHDGELRALANALGVARVTIEGPVYGDAKCAAYRGAALFVLPTFNESFGLTVAEALAAGVPAISTKGAPWKGLKTEGCGWWIDHEVESFAATLAHAMALPAEVLKAMGNKGHEWVARDFSWDRVARDMLDVYFWAARGAEPPPTIRFD